MAGSTDAGTNRKVVAWVHVTMDGFTAAANDEVTLLKRTAMPTDVGNVAALLASDQARTITATEVNISRGAIVD